MGCISFLLGRGLEAWPPLIICLFSPAGGPSATLPPAWEPRWGGAVDWACPTTGTSDKGQLPVFPQIWD